MRRVFVVAVIAISIAGLASPGVAGATTKRPWWRVHLTGIGRGATDDGATAVATDGANNVFVAGMMTVPLGHSLAVAKLQAANGRKIWLDRIVASPPGLNDFAGAIALDTSGNAVVGGTLGDDATVIKLNGATGGQMWRYDAGRGYVSTARVDGAGDVTAVVASNGHANLVKLRGADGSLVWQAVDVMRTANGAQLDANGDVFVAGLSDVHPTTYIDFTVVKLHGADGSEAWRQEIHGTNSDPNVLSVDEANALTVDHAGNVIAAGQTTNDGSATDGTIIKFAGSDGTVLWQRNVSGTAPGYDILFGVAVDAADNVLATGSLSDAGAFGDMYVGKLDGTDGATLWQHSVDGTLHSIDDGTVVSADASNNVVAAGMVDQVFNVRRFAGIDGTQRSSVNYLGSRRGSGSPSAVTVAGDGSIDVVGGATYGRRRQRLASRPSRGIARRRRRAVRCDGVQAPSG